ncbi:winged helix-turn-helix transcriptional regulator [Candidatus Woesearchaeota archaeon]|nr:winged helix-turn-helix transcriptional regulator [Candidatus Woesearchaeota archaeon]
MIVRRITIVTNRRPTTPNLNDELQWLGNSLGLLGERDRDKSCFRIFIELLKAIKATGGLTSDQLSDKLALTRATVVHHLNSLQERGIVLHQGNQYIMREHQLTNLVDDIKRDMERALSDMKKAAEELDRILEL